MPITDDRRDRAITLRSITLGLLGAVIICVITPYNDYALNNTFFVGNCLPIGLTLLAFLFVICINGPLSRWKPAAAFTSGEMGVAFILSLVACSIPSSGLFRYLIPNIVGTLYQANGDAEFIATFDGMMQRGLPHWLFPDYASANWRDWMLDPLTTGYAGRWTGDGPIPYARWITPLFAWGIFSFALFGAVVCMMTLVRRQWMENERLAFPLAQIQLSLIEAPRPGRWLNELMRKRSFWIAFAAIFCLHVLNGLHAYFPKSPVIPINFDLNMLFGSPPLSYTDNWVRVQTIYFTVIGVTYFVSQPIAFSMWAFFILQQLARMSKGVATGEPTLVSVADQQYGAALAYLLVTLYVGRKHWALIVRQAFRGERDGEPRGRYLPYPAAFWAMLACLVVMVVWLCKAHVQPHAAVILVVMLLGFFFLLARVVAETGLIHPALTTRFTKPWQVLSYEGVDKPVSMESFYVTSQIDQTHFDCRESLAAFSNHAMKIADRAVFNDRMMNADLVASRRTGRRLIGLMFVALFVGYIVGARSFLWTEYTFASSRDIKAEEPINKWGLTAAKTTVESVDTYAKGKYFYQSDPLAGAATGFTWVGLCSILRLRYTWWPLHPVGFLLLGTFPGVVLWFSIFVGWLFKLIVLRFGGSQLYAAMKPMVLGMIVGESIAAGGWLVAGMVMSAMGVPYRAIMVMPY